MRAIIVAGHSVLVRFENLRDDASWALLDFQKGEPPLYMGHVRAAVELAAADPDALLIFSGGPTRLEAGPLSEAFSYYHAARHHDWFGHPAVAARAILEEFARDSFENLLFGLCRAKEYAGSYPEHVTVVSWAFKERRFGLHREAVGLPAGRFSYSGPNNPRNLDQALASERNAIEAYTRDPYSSGDRFRAKRQDRNPFRRQNGYAIGCPELVSLLKHEGPELYRGPVPW